MNLLTQNTKMAKGSGLPLWGIELAPHTTTKWNTCPMASLRDTAHNMMQCLEYLEKGGNVAIPFPVTLKSGNALPKKWMGYPVVNGDKDDRTFRHKQGTVVGLYFKGAKRHMENGCSDYCVFKSGHGQMPAVWQNRVWRTELLHTNPRLFLEMLWHEISGKKGKTKKKLGIRPNVFSDLMWHTRAYEHQGKTMMEAFSRDQFYGYTKVPKQMNAFINGELPPNYHLTFSFNKVWNEETMGA